METGRRWLRSEVRRVGPEPGRLICFCCVPQWFNRHRSDRSEGWIVREAVDNVFKPEGHMDIYEILLSLIEFRAPSGYSINRERVICLPVSLDHLRADLAGPTY